MSTTEEPRTKTLFESQLEFYGKLELNTPDNIRMESVVLIVAAAIADLRYQAEKLNLILANVAENLAKFTDSHDRLCEAMAETNEELS